LPRLLFPLAPRILHRHFFYNISTYCWRIHLALSTLTNGSQSSNVSKISATAVLQCSGWSETCFKQLCPRILDWCFFSRTQPPISSSTCWPHNSLPAQSCWQIALRRTQFDSGWLSVCPLYCPSLRNHHSHHQHHNRHPKSLPIGARPQSLLHWFSVVPLVAGMFLLGAWSGVTLVSQMEVQVEYYSWKISPWFTLLFSASPAVTLNAPGDDSPRPETCRGVEHLRTTITTLEEIISLPLLPITWISLAYAGGWLWTVCHVEWRLVIKLQSPWKWLLSRQVTIPMRRMTLVSVLPKLTVFACGSWWTNIQGSWIVVTALLQAEYATLWSQFYCLWWKYICRHAPWIQLVGK